MTKLMRERMRPDLLRQIMLADPLLTNHEAVAEANAVPDLGTEEPKSNPGRDLGKDRPVEEQS
jgi:hypothetical protein